MDSKYITITDNDGNIFNYEIILAFYWSKTKKHYLIYTDNTYENEKLNVSAAIYYPNDETRLDEITTEEEWNEIAKKLGELNEY